MALFRSASILLLFVPFLLAGQSGTYIQWKKTTPSAERRAGIDAGLILPAGARFFETSFDQLNNALSPVERSGKTFINLPLGEDGADVELEVIYDAVMGPGDQVRFPDIRTYIAYAHDGTLLTGRIGISSEGFYGIFDADGHQYMMRHSATDRNLYMVYDLDEKLALLDKDILAACGTESVKEDRPVKEKISGRSEERKKRHFRIAISCTSGFAKIVGATESQVMAKVVQTVNLLNQRYNVDFGIKLDLIDNTSQLFNLDPATDYFVNQSKGLELLQQNQDFLNTLISPDQYDLAQVFTKNCTDVGGVVWGRACDNNNKARGVSCRSNDEDYFFTTFKHEVGHQFDGGHTFNACNGSTQYDPNSSYEPGAGSTILSYGNNCGDDNVGERKDYFHVINILEVSNYATETEALCGSWGPDVNHSPVATVISPQGLTIPARTPFELEGSATDEDGHQLTYNWEQFDIGAGEPLGTNFEKGPLFITQEPRASGGTRLFPNLSDIVAGINSLKERLPEVSRELNFRMTVRDNYALAGAHDIVSYKVDATADAGPFKITFPSRSTDTTFAVGQYVEITWDVAKTDLDPVNCKYVNIMLSTTDGQTWKDTLVARTPNDGREYVMMPRTSGKSRFKVKAVDNIFLDISGKAIRIVQPETAGYGLDVLPHDAVVCKNSVFEYKISSVSWKEFGSKIRIEVIDAGNDALIVYPSKAEFLPGEDMSLIVDTRDVAQAGSYTITLRALAEGGDTLYREVHLAVSGDDQKFLGAISPQNLDQDVPPVNPVFEWNKTSNSIHYEIQISDDPSFGTALYSTVQSSNKLVLDHTLEAGKIYYWRVRSLGNCGYGRWSDLQIFRTATAQAHNILQQVNNTVLNVRTNGSRYITHEELYYFSLQQPDEALTYTLLSLPDKGILYKDADALKVGDRFSQADIDGNHILYSSTSPDYQGGDIFSFIASDVINTFIGPHDFVIDINDGHPASSGKISIDHIITVLPNPVSGQVTVQYSGKDMLRDAAIQVFDTNGRLMYNAKKEGQWKNVSIDLSSYAPSTYIVVVKSGNYISKKRVVKI